MYIPITPFKYGIQPWNWLAIYVNLSHFLNLWVRTTWTPKNTPTKTSSGSCSNEPLRLWEHGRTLPWVARHCATSIPLARRSLYRCEEWRQLGCQGMEVLRGTIPGAMDDVGSLGRFICLKWQLCHKHCKSVEGGVAGTLITWCCFKGCLEFSINDEPMMKWLGWKIPHQM